MKRILIIGLLMIIAIIGWIGEKRKFYAIGENKYVTVWKTFGNVCYIIPDKYYGITKPSTNHLETTNDNDVVLFFSNELPNQIVFWNNRQDREISVDNKAKDKILFVDYLSGQDSLHKLLYKPDAKKVRDLKDNAQMLDINIGDNYATNKNGMKM